MSDAATSALVRWIAVLAGGIGLTVLIGWSFDLPMLKSGIPDLRATQPLTAVCLVISGLALFCRCAKARAAQVICGGLTVLVLLTAVATGLQNNWGIDLGLDRWLFGDEVLREQAQQRQPGRIPGVTAAVFALIAASLLTARASARWLQAVFVLLATAGLLVTLSVLAGLLFGVKPLAGLGLHVQLALPSTLGQLLLLFGLLLLRPDLGWMRLLAGESAAARELRSLAAWVIALPAAFALVLQLGMRSGLYDADFRSAAMVLASIVAVFLALLMTARRLQRIDQDRQRLSAVQQRTEAELAMALNASNMSGFRWDLQHGTIRRFVGSHRGSRILVQENETYGNYLKSVHPDDRAGFDDHVQTVLRDRQSKYQQEYRLRRPNGEVAWMLDQGEVHFDEFGQPRELAGISIDVTQIVQAHAALRESEERFRRLAEGMPQIVYISGAHGAVEYINRRWLEYTGRARANREDYEQLIPRDDFLKLMAAWEEAVAAGRPLTAEFRLRGADGVYRWYLTRAMPIRNEDGAIVRWCGTSTDVDVQKRAQEELRLVTDHADVLLVHCDRERRYLFVNRAYAKRFEKQPHELVGRHLREVLGDAAYEMIEPYVARALAGEHVTFEVEVPYERIGSRFMHCRYVPQLDPTSGEVCGFVAAITDVTERRRLEDELRHADRRKDEFLATLAHELRNPLAPIRYAVGLLKPGIPAEISAAARDVIERQVAHMAHLVDDLLDVSRMTRNVLELRLEQLDFRKAVSAAVDAARPLIEAVNHTLTVSMPPEPLPMMGDLTRLQQILGNLLNNAAKYTEPGGHIYVEAHRQAEIIVLRVRDSGIGVSPEFLPRIFDWFVQGDASEVRTSGGLGVGLALAKRLVELHGGRIEAHSDGLQKGSTFTVTFPAVVSATLERPALHDNVVPIFQRRHQLLIVDDNLDAANSLAILLQLSGYVTHIANDGLAAIEMADIVRPEAIVMDIGLPKMTGYDAARWVRQQPWGKDTLLIAVTGWGQEEDRRRSREAGFDVHLTKPVDSSVLLKHLHQRHVEPMANHSGET